MKKTMIAAALAITLAVAGAAFAQQKGPNGGMVAGKDGHETELVVSPTELTVYLLEKGKPSTTKGASIRAVVQEAGKALNVELKDVDNKRLVGALPAPLGKGAIVVLTGKDHDGHSVSARFVVN